MTVDRAPLVIRLRQRREQLAVEVARLIGFSPSVETQFAAMVNEHMKQMQDAVLDAIAEPSEAMIRAYQDTRSQDNEPEELYIARSYRAMLAALRAELAND